MALKVVHYRYARGQGGAVEIESPDGGHVLLNSSNTKGRITLLRDDARRLRKFADDAEQQAKMPPQRAV